MLTISFLTQDELRELTDLRVPKAQMRWLQKHAYPFEISGAGKPKVLKSFVLDRLQNISNIINIANEPNFDYSASITLSGSATIILSG